MFTRKFDTKVQYLKYQVLKEVAKSTYNDTLQDDILNIPYKIVPGKESTMRCCVYKERAILTERIKLALGGDKTNPNMVEVIDIACDDCPAGGYQVSNACRGCLAHRCEQACKLNAITFDQHQHAFINKDKCVDCGMCAKACQYGAIINFKRPCEVSCKINAISMSSDKSAKINNDKCTMCGACVYQCPFGAIMDKSFIVNVVKMLKENNATHEHKIYAVVAPSISSQFKYGKLGQLISGIKLLGFHAVVEAALGADMTAYKEAKELSEKGFLTSSCCPSFVRYVENEFPNLKQHISHNLSPMAEISKWIKENDKTAKVVFIGPCISKKMEIRKPSVSPYVDEVLTFEELLALLDAKEINISSLEEDVLDNASYYGRIFARSGGVSDAVVQAIKEQNIDFEVKSCACSGLDVCRSALLKKSKDKLDANFIEGMACSGGCINGAGILTHGVANGSDVDKYGKEAFEKTISDAIKVIK